MSCAPAPPKNKSRTANTDPRLMLPLAVKRDGLALAVAPQDGVSRFTKCIALHIKVRASVQPDRLGVSRLFGPGQPGIFHRALEAVAGNQSDVDPAQRYGRLAGTDEGVAGDDDVAEDHRAPAKGVGKN